MLEAVRYCLMQADAGLVDLKKTLKIKREEYEFKKQTFDKQKD